MASTDSKSESQYNWSYFSQNSESQSLPAYAPSLLNLLTQQRSLEIHAAEVAKLNEKHETSAPKRRKLDLVLFVNEVDDAKLFENIYFSITTKTTEQDHEVLRSVIQKRGGEVLRSLKTMHKK